MEIFGQSPLGEDVGIVTIANGGLTARVMTWGASLQDLRMEGLAHGLVLGSPELAAYFGPLLYSGAVVGRVANRIAGGRLAIGGRTYDLSRNEAGRTTLHGGRTGTAEVNWRLAAQDSASCRMEVVLADGQDGFPGRMEIAATYRLTGEGLLEVVLEARCDAPTVCNLAHHGYWCLDGSGSHAGHLLTVPAEHYTPVDADNIPQGAPAPVNGTRFDYRAPRQITAPGEPGIDHNFCFADDGQMRRLCTLSAGAVRMDISSTAPGLQVYDGRHLDTAPFAGSDGVPYGPYAGVALEPQGWPDAPNRPDFPPVGLNPGETYSQVSRFAFVRSSA